MGIRLNQHKSSDKRILRIRDDGPVCLYQQKMMQKASFILSHRWEGKTLIYEADPAMIPLNTLLERAEERLIARLFKELIRIREEAAAYLLDEQCLFTQPAWIFWHPDKERFFWIYLPFERAGSGANPLQRLCGYFLIHASRSGWPPERWQLLGEFCCRIYGKNLDEARPADAPGPAETPGPGDERQSRHQEMEQALDELMAEKDPLPPLILREAPPTEKRIKRILRTIKKAVPIEI